MDYDERLHEYTHLKKVEDSRYKDKITQKASILWAMMTTCLSTGSGSLDVLRETERIVGKDEVMSKPSYALDLLKKRKIKLDVTLLPEMNRRYCLPMPKNMDPELFIGEKKILLRMLQKLDFATSDREADFITNILSQLPMEHYLKVYEELVAISRRNGMPGNSMAYEAASTTGTTGASTTAVKVEVDPEQKEIEDKIKTLEASGTANAHVIAILKSLCKKKGPSISSSTIEKFGVDPLDLSTVQHALKVRYDELVRNNVVKPASSKEATSYFVNVPGIGGERKPKKGDRNEEPKKLNKYENADKGDGGGSGKKTRDHGKKNHGKGDRRLPCYLCDSLEHFLSDCPMKAKVKELMGTSAAKPSTEESSAKDSGKDGKSSGQKLKKSVGFGGHVSGISYHIADELVRFDSQLFLDDNGSNTDIVNDENLLVEVHPVDAFVNGVGSAKVTGIGVFIGKSINRDGSEVPIARKRVLVCPSFGRNIIGTSVLQRRDDVVFNRQCKDPHMLAIVGDDEDEVLQYDLHDNPADKDDPFLYFQLVPLDEDEMTEEHEEFIEEASKNNLKEVRALQSHVYQTQLNRAKKEVKKKRVTFEPTPSDGVAAAAIEKAVKAVKHANTRKGVKKDDPVEDMFVKASINATTTVADIAGADA